MNKGLLYAFVGILIVLFGIVLVYKTNDPTTQTTNTQSDAQEPQSNINPLVDNVESDPNKITEKNSLVPGFPQFPVYPNAVLIESVKMIQATDDKGYYALWEIDQEIGVPAVMQWYIDELQNTGWEITEYPAYANQGEQIIKLKKGTTNALVNVDSHGKGVEILVDFPLTYEE